MSPPPGVSNSFQIEPTPFNLKRCALITDSTSCVRGIISRLGTDGFLVHCPERRWPDTCLFVSRMRGAETTAKQPRGRSWLSTGKMTQDVASGHLSKTRTLHTARHSENAGARTDPRLRRGQFNASITSVREGAASWRRRRTSRARRRESAGTDSRGFSKTDTER